MFVNFLLARYRTKDISVFAHEFISDEGLLAIAASEAVWFRVPRKGVVVEALRRRSHFTLARVTYLSVDVIVAFHAEWTLVFGDILLSGQQQVT